MSIASRITEIEGHITNAYDKIEDLGIDTTNVDKNLNNISNLLEDVYKEYPKVPANDVTEASLENTKQGRLDINLKGNIFQQTYTGKNKLSYPVDFTETPLGITVNENKGIYTLSGTSSYAGNVMTEHSLQENYTIQSGDYLHFMNNTVASNFALILIDTDNNVNSFGFIETNRIFNLSNYVGKTIKAIRIYCNSSNIPINMTFSPMITNSSTATDFEEYVGGTASPSPRFPQEVEVVNGDVDVKVQNKNYWDMSDYPRGIYNEDGSLTVVNTYGTTISGYSKSYKNILNAGTYTFKNISGGRCFIQDKDHTGYTQFVDEGNSLTFEYDGTSLLTFLYGNQEANTTRTYKAQLEPGSTATDYVSHEEQTAILTLPEGMELCKIGDYQDQIFKNTKNSTMYNSRLIEGAWYKYNIISKIILNGTQGFSITNWRPSETSIGWIYPYSLTKHKQTSSISLPLLISDKLVRAVYYRMYEKYVDNGISEVNEGALGLVVRVADTSLTNATAINNYLSENPITVYFVLATPKYEQITDTDFIEQLEAIYKLKSYNTQTNISQTNDTLPFILDISALRKD